MLYLHSSNRLECLAQALIEHLREQPVSHPLAPVTIAVPHPGVQHWLSLCLAQADGIAMNYDFPLASRFMWRQVGRLSPDQGDSERWTREVMVWSLYDLLGEPDIESDPVFELPQRYIDKTRSAGGRYQLAAQVADLFEQYLMYRPDMLLGWQAGEAPDDWQACLWRKLAQGNATPVNQLQSALAAARAGQPLATTEPVRLFALHILPPIWLELLDALALHQDVHLYVLNPSEAWWGDLRSQCAQLGEAMRALRMGQPVTPPDASTLALQEGHPLLAQLGRQGQAWLNSLAERDTGAGTQIWEVPEASHTLARLQRSLLELDPKQARTGQQDSSFKVVSAHSPMREVQALHDWLLERFAEDPTLKPRDVVVMTPEIERYAPLVEAVFDTTGYSNEARLPASLSDRRAVDADPLIRAFIELLGLPDARLERGWVLDHMRLPAARARWGWDEDDLQRVERWMEQAAIYRGLDAEHLQSQGLPPHSRFTWYEGLRRLLLGAVMGDAPVVLEGEALVTVPDVPDAEALSLAGKVLQFIDQLQAARRELLQPRPAAAWAEWLLDMLQGLYAETPGNVASWQQIRDALRGWVQAVEQAAVTLPLPLAVVRAALKQTLGDHQVQGGYLAGRVTFCSLVPLRSVPFRLVCLLGLSADSFPRSRPPLPFDKMAEAPRWGDRSRRDDDLYLFLESILSARDGLYLSYVGRSIRDDSPCEPAWPLRTLMDVVGIEKPVQLPLQPFDLKHYTPGDPLQSWDPRWLKVARHLAGTAGGGQSAQADAPLDTLLNAQLPEVMTLDFITKLLDDPVGQFARHVLGLKLDEVEEDPEAEPFALGGLAKWQVADEWMRASLVRPDDLATLEKRLALSGKLPAHPFPEEAVSEQTRVATLIVERMQALSGGQAPEWREISVRLASGHTLQAGYWQAGDTAVLAGASSIRARRWLEARILMRMICAQGDVDPERFSIKLLGRASSSRPGDKQDRMDEQELKGSAMAPAAAQESLERLMPLLDRFWKAPLPLPLDCWLDDKGQILSNAQSREGWEAWWQKSKEYGEKKLPPNGERLPYALFWHQRPAWQPNWGQVVGELCAWLTGGAQDEQ
ncbi:MAG: exodeoxyribonuclease V subunit gamma [Gammaproteobacteria bacterium]|nr:MAG: exodeoxyribonuclease V subunit gamma [Gammaproteobacteria bacterium]